jgi:hypothetical protein
MQTKTETDRPIGTPARLPAAKPRRRVRAWWMKQLHGWHSMSAAVSLIGMLLFAATGLTLNHAGSIGATPKVVDRSTQLPAPLLALLRPHHAPGDPLPAAVATYLAPRLGLDAGTHTVDWSDDEADVSMPGPGRDAWISIDRASGVAKSETTDQGWISYLNDLHKGRNTGPVWFWFIDVFAVACLFFTGTGLVLLYLHARHRRSSWPLVGLGLLTPLIIALLFIH